jgi:hypothetical protein
MAALTIAAAAVAYVSGPVLADQVAGEAFAAGVNVYQNDNGVWLKAKNSGTALEAGQNATGLALGTADAVGARVSIAQPGAVVAVGTSAAGVIYVIGAVAGQLVPAADLVATARVTPVALGIGTNRLQLVRAYNPTAIL